MTSLEYAQDTRTRELEAELTRLRKVSEIAVRLAEDSESELHERYGNPPHPALKPKYDRDMEPVNALRAALDGKEVEK